MTHLAKDFPYRNTKVNYNDSKVHIEQMLSEAGAIGLNWHENAFSLKGEALPELSFMFQTELNGVQTKFAVKMKPPLLMDKKRKYVQEHYRNEIVSIPNRNASMRLLYWYLKARLEGVRFGLEDLFDAFMSRVMNQLPDGKIVTFSEAVKEHPEVIRGILPEFEIKVKALPVQEVEGATE